MADFEHYFEENQYRHWRLESHHLDFRLLFVPHQGNSLVTVADRQTYRHTISTRLAHNKKKKKKKKKIGKRERYDKRKDKI